MDCIYTIITGAMCCNKPYITDPISVSTYAQSIFVIARNIWFLYWLPTAGLICCYELRSARDIKYRWVPKQHLCWQASSLLRGERSLQINTKLFWLIAFRNISVLGEMALSRAAIFPDNCLVAAELIQKSTETCCLPKCREIHPVLSAGSSSCSKTIKKSAISLI